MIGRALLDHLARIGQVSAEDREAILKVSGELKLFKRHEDIAKAGTVPTSSAIVVSGFLQRYVSRRDGSRQIHSFYLPGDAPSLESVHLDRLDSNLSAVVPSRLAVIPHAELLGLMKGRPQVQKLLWRSSIVQSALYREWLMRNSRLTACSAMAHIFCEIYTRSAVAGLNEGNSCLVPLTQEMLGDALGLTGVHVNRSLQQLRDTGLVDHHRGRLFVHDFSGLADLADFDPAYLHFRNGHAR